MNLDQILQDCRGDLDDEIGSDTQKLWSNRQLVRFANNAIREIIKELRCLIYDNDFAETLATGTITLSGTAGQINSVSVNGLVVTSAVVPFNATLNQTVSDLAANINAFAVSPQNTNPIKFTAQAVNAVVTITAPANTGTTPNGYLITSSCSGGMSYVSASMTGGACRNRLFFIPGQTNYYIDTDILQIIRFKPFGKNTIDPVSKQQLDAQYTDWVTYTPGDPINYIPNYDSSLKRITIFPAPKVAYTVDIDVVSYPRSSDELDLNLPKGTPVIPNEYQDAINPWMKHEAFLKTDRETLNMNKSMAFANPTMRTGEFYHKIEESKRIRYKNRIANAGTNQLPMGVL